MHALMRRLWPICRSLTGPGVRQTLDILRERVPEMVIHEVPTGTPCFDWTVPEEWTIRDAYLQGPDGERVVDFRQNNLHVVGYSSPVDRELDLEELQPHLFSIPNQPDAIPYVTSYYQETWGFCLAHRVRDGLRPGRYRVRIDSDRRAGSLTYGEAFLPGDSAREILLSTYVCHPSMANNELSGPVVVAALAEWLRGRSRRYGYRLVFVPETLGAICFISRNLEPLKSRVKAGYVVTCCGDERAWSFVPSPDGSTLSDRAARHVLQRLAPEYREYSFVTRGSDERQYCSPGVDLPIASIMRSKYGTYPEYHTSRDDLTFVTARGLQTTLEVYEEVLRTIEDDCVPKTLTICEPQLSKRGLYPTLSRTGSNVDGAAMMNLLAYANGVRTLLEIATIIEQPVTALRQVVALLVRHDLMSVRPSDASDRDVRA